MSELVERARKEAEELLGNRQRKTLRETADEIERLYSEHGDMNVHCVKLEKENEAAAAEIEQKQQVINDIAKLCRVDAERTKTEEGLQTLIRQIWYFTERSTASDERDPYADLECSAADNCNICDETAASDALKVCRQALLEVAHAQQCGPDWYTKGESGLRSQVDMWIRRGTEAIKSASDARCCEDPSTCSKRAGRSSCASDAQPYVPYDEDKAKALVLGDTYKEKRVSTGRGK